MQMDEELASGVYTVQHYDSEGFSVLGRIFSGILLISPRRVETISTEVFEDADQLLASVDVVQRAPVLILGTGNQQVFPSAERLKQLMKTSAGQSRSVEVMDSGAACRTYNLLAGDGRAVVAVIEPIV